MGSNHQKKRTDTKNKTTKKYSTYQLNESSSDGDQRTVEKKMSDEIKNKEKVQNEQCEEKVVKKHKLSEKALRIKKEIEHHRRKVNGIKLQENNRKKVRSLTMRVGRKPRKTLVDQEKTKPCFVRLEKVGKEKLASLSPQERTPVNRKLSGPLKKRSLNSQSQVLKKVKELNQSTQSQLENKIQERLQYTPSQVVKRLPGRPPNSSKKHPGRPSNSQNKVVKKVQDRPQKIPLSAAVKKALQRALNTPSPPVQRVLQRPLITPSSAAKKVPQRPLNFQSHEVVKKVQQSSPNTPSQVVKKVRGPSTTVASTRTRRAPKPNPKYANADIITPKSKAKRTKERVAYDTDANESDEDFYNDLDDTSVGSESNYGDVDADDAFMMEGDSSDFSENDDVKPKRLVRASNNSPGSGSKRGRPKKKYSPPAVVRTFVKPVAEQKKNIQHTLPQRTVTSVLQQQQQARKRKLEEMDNEVEPVESIIARNKRLNIALYDANDSKPTSTLKSDGPRVVRSLVRPRNQSPAPSSLLNQKRVFQGPNAIKSNQASMAKETQKESSKSPQIQRRSPAAAAVKYIESVDSASTQDDFETMPTFTIVNIHDIINKKGDCLIQKNADEDKGTTSPNTSNRVNRRKSGHTTILSEKIDPVKLRNPLPRTPFPPKKPISTILNSNPPPRPEPKLQPRIAIPPPEKKPVQAVAEKPAPRILNSVVAKRTYPVKPILGKLDNDIQLAPIEDPVEKTQMVKENVGANKLLPIKPALPRKLPPEKVFVQRQGNKLIKKITCFETWYVINIPEVQEPVVKNQLDIPLITLANAVKSIRLPSSAWSTKVTVYKLSTQVTSKTPMIPFIGDLSDQSIPEQDRDKYQPSCVMFRRMTQKKSKTRMPYDRAVIFKMKTFFTNIDGKNVRLIGAPSTVKSFEDIEILLELIDELDLVHEFVEPANTV